MKRHVAKLLRDLTGFFSLEKARAVLVSDVKLDDLLCLWVVLMHNFARPVHHQISVDVYITGIQDSAAASCLCRHLFEVALAAASKSGACCPVAFRALASKRPAKTAPRHERDTYRPYRDGSAGFPQADESSLVFWEDLPAEARGADFVGVIAQFFNFELIDENMAMREGLLSFIVPKPGGLLAFQSGFNTRVPGDKEEEVWAAIAGEVKKAGARMALISNGFSFDKSTGRSGMLPPDAPAMKYLETLSPVLWTHLRYAGLQETLRFSVDQIAKWLIQVPMQGVDYGNVTLQEGLATIRSRYAVPDGVDVGDYLHAQFLAQQHDPKQEANTVLTACRELHALADSCCGAAAADYLCRAAENLEKFGRSLEITDGQHFAALLQSEAPVLEPCALVRKDRFLQPEFLEDAGAEHVTWAARNIDVPQNMAWMEKALCVDNLK